MADNSKLPAVITNVSGRGCAVATGFVLGQPGSRLTVSFRLKLRDKSRVVRLPLRHPQHQGQALAADAIRR
jgi:hypothetical protein